ncbi:MAG TPA: c-type cytochrome [Gemmatimonadales bacterium]|nr:c-type cytochrome [Gemmatimonadales bacterium]
MSAQASLELTQESFAEGQANLLQLLQAQRLYQQARLGCAKAKGQRYLDTAQLFVAMGGGWREWSDPDKARRGAGRRMSPVGTAKGGRMARCLALVMGMAFTASAFAQSPGGADGEIRKLTAASGCDLCHTLEPRKSPANEVLPIGPSWKDIARKYRGQKDAVDRLTNIVLQGSGSGPRDRHWSREASGVAMPPNTVEISRADAERVVRWILSLQN